MTSYSLCSGTVSLAVPKHVYDELLREQGISTAEAEGDSESLVAVLPSKEELESFVVPDEEEEPPDEDRDWTQEDEDKDAKSQPQPASLVAEVHETTDLAREQRQYEEVKAMF